MRGEIRDELHSRPAHDLLILVFMSQEPVTPVVPLERFQESKQGRREMGLQPMRYYFV
jgi:hypothetical protein